MNHGLKLYELELVKFGFNLLNTVFHIILFFRFVQFVTVRVVLAYDAEFWVALFSFILGVPTRRLYFLKFLVL